MQLAHCTPERRDKFECQLLHRVRQTNPDWVGNNGRPEWIRTIDLFRVKKEVMVPKPFSSLVFRIFITPKTPLESYGFGDQSVTSDFRSVILRNFGTSKLRSALRSARKRSVQTIANKDSEFGRTEEVKRTKSACKKSCSHFACSLRTVLARGVGRSFLQGNSKRCPDDPF